MQPKTLISRREIERTSQRGSQSASPQKQCREGSPGKVSQTASSTVSVSDLLESAVTCDGTDFIQVMGSICLSLIDVRNDPFDFVTACPLYVAWMFVDPADILPDLWLDRSKEEIVDNGYSL